MREKSAEAALLDVLQRLREALRQFETNLVRDGLPTGTAKERGFVFPVADNFEGLARIKECANQLGLRPTDYAIGTDNAFSEIQKGDELIAQGLYEMRFSGAGTKTREELVAFDGSVVQSADNFIPYLCAKKREDRAGNSVLIKLNQAGTFTETRLATEIVLGLADVELVEQFLHARADLGFILDECAKVGVKKNLVPISNTSLTDLAFIAKKNISWMSCLVRARVRRRRPC